MIKFFFFFKSENPHFAWEYTEFAHAKIFAYFETYILLKDCTNGPTIVPEPMCSHSLNILLFYKHECVGTLKGINSRRVEVTGFKIEIIHKKTHKNQIPLELDLLFGTRRRVQNVCNILLTPTVCRIQLFKSLKR